MAVAAASCPAQTTEQRIAEIRRIDRETARRISEAEMAYAAAKEAGGIAGTEIFLTAMQFNKGNAGYPAVGVFREEAKFYFTFGGNRESPYPERLLKIIVVTHRAAAIERREYLFDAAGSLIFYFEDPDSENTDRDGQTRCYFFGGKLIRFQAGTDIRTNSPIFRRKNEIVREVSEKAKKLMNVFRNSL